MFPLFGGGSGEYARGLMTALAAQGHAVGITCPDARRFSDSVVVYPFHLPVRVVFNSHPELPDAVRFPDLETRQLGMLLEALEDALDDAIDAFRPDVVHVHHASVLAWAAQRRCSAKGVPYLVTAHGTDLLTAGADARFVAPTLAALSKAELVTVVSDHTRRRLLDVPGLTIPDSRIAVRRPRAVQRHRPGRPGSVPPASAGLEGGAVLRPLEPAQGLRPARRRRAGHPPIHRAARPGRLLPGPLGGRVSGPGVRHPRRVRR